MVLSGDEVERDAWVARQECRSDGSWWGVGRKAEEREGRGRRGRQGVWRRGEQRDLKGGGLGGEWRMKGGGVQGRMEGCSVRGSGVQDEEQRGQGHRGEGRDGGVKWEGLWGARPGQCQGCRGAR